MVVANVSIKNAIVRKNVNIVSVVNPEANIVNVVSPETNIVNVVNPEVNLVNAVNPVDIMSLVIVAKITANVINDAINVISMIVNVLNFSYRFQQNADVSQLAFQSWLNQPLLLQLEM